MHDLDIDELTPHYLLPNYLRPEIPEEILEEDDDMEPIWLYPGILPELYWDFNMS